MHPTFVAMQSRLEVAIVPAGPSDADGLAGVHVQSWRETYLDILPSGYLERMSPPLHARRWRSRLMQLNEVTLVAESADGLVGFCSGDWVRWRGPDTTEAEVHTLYVLKSMQGLGLGRRLMTGAARALAARGATALSVAVLRDNLPARLFYEHLGGVLEGEHVEMVGGTSVAAVDYRWEDLKGLANREHL
jgi:GNAT superfamily N-acetyltransferase